MLRNKKGFTLIELMIVVAIIGILAAIAIPNFLKFQAKSKQSEAKTNLKGIYTAETGYFGEVNSYGDYQTVNWEPVGNSRYRFTLLTGSTDEGNMTLTFDAWAGATPLWTTNSFTAGAQGNVDSDVVNDQWTITDMNVLANSFNDV
ncbi:MAG: prepilin-type N-terminal cleavage/methylation domain-containing protein [Candidatus Deferrimicrobiaceae bacterium]